MVFPNVNIPNLNRGEPALNLPVRAPIFDFEAGEFVQSPDGKILESNDPSTTFQQIVRLRAITRRGAYPIYDFEFGTDIYDLIGKDPDFVLAKINRIVQESLRDARILDLRVKIESQNDSGLSISISLVNARGDLSFRETIEVTG